jgi:hypothetical protein
MSMATFSLSDNTSFQAKGDDQLQTILTQLTQAATTMQHMDEVFGWLAHTAVHRFGVQVAQVWAMQANMTEQLSPKLRSIQCQDLSLPYNILDNAQIATLAERMLSERRNTQFLPVDAYFSQYLALLLKRHGLYYCTGIFVGDDMLLPPPHMSLPKQKVATPLTMALLLFFRFVPHQDMLSTIGKLVTEALPIASSRGFLLSAPTSGGSILYAAESLFHMQGK